jgi:hypothetical protein
MPPAGFTPALSASERPQTHALDRTTVGIDINFVVPEFNNFIHSAYIEVRLVFYIKPVYFPTRLLQDDTVLTKTFEPYGRQSDVAL